MIIDHGAITSYFPYWVKDENGNKIRNPRWTKECGFILDIKENGQKCNNAKNWALPQLLEVIRKKVVAPARINVVCIVPGHVANSVSPALVDLSRTMAARLQAIAYPTLVQRIHTIEKLAYGANRAEHVHYQSMQVSDPGAVQGQTVLLIDDVRTTGNSMKVASMLLEQAGARVVHRIAIGQTG